MANTLTMKSTVGVLPNAAAAFLTVPASTTFAINSILVGNYLGTATANLTITITKSGGSAVVLVSDNPVVAKSCMEFVLGKGIFLEAGDVLSLHSGTASALSAIVSYVQDVVS